MQQERNYLSVDQVFDRAGVNRAGFEGLVWQLYSTQTYAAAGQTSLSFFTTPRGADPAITNMTLASQIPANQFYHLQSIAVRFIPGTGPGVFGAEPGGASVFAINDTFSFYTSGNLNLSIGSKPYVDVSPLVQFPPKQELTLNAAIADQSTIAASQSTRFSYMHAYGRPYKLGPGYVLQANQNFSLTLSWATAVPLPSGVAGTVRVEFDGVLYRRSQ